MLTCLPASMCSWDFRVHGLSTGTAHLTFNFFAEHGSLSLGGIQFAIRKHGPLSGRWTLEHAGNIYADARKPNPLFRSFELETATDHLTVQAENPFTRSFEVRAAGQRVGTIRPAHAFTRRAFVDCNSAVPELIQLFAFWLAVLTWRRAARNNS